jgi:hypothetical protein
LLGGTPVELLGYYSEQVLSLVQQQQQQQQQS